MRDALATYIKHTAHTQGSVFARYMTQTNRKKKKHQAGLPRTCGATSKTVCKPDVTT